MISCTGQVPGSFRLAQQTQKFQTKRQVNTKIDLLWVVDNSSSMDVSQDKLRKGFEGFAIKYMLPTWDIRVAFITTDTYLAHPAYKSYLDQLIPGTKGKKSPYIFSRLSTFVNPVSNPNLVNLTTGIFDFGFTIRDLVPSWGSQYSLLLPGIHDGPVAAFCVEQMPYFLKGVTQCAIRDQQNLYNGPENCLNPKSGQNSITQCINTVENNTVRSGNAIISTLPADKDVKEMSKSDLYQWSSKLVRDFMINMSTGSAGHGSERGLSSVLQLLEDNEKTSTAFFRPDSVRGIIFVSDEEDQSLKLESDNPSELGVGFGPYTHYLCDQAGLVVANPGASITTTNGFCCSEASKNCTFGKEGTSCPSKTVEGYQYTISVCPKSELLIPVSEVKEKLDSFFIKLDLNSASPNPSPTSTPNPRYFIASIVPLTASSLMNLQEIRRQDDIQVGGLKTLAVDRGDRYMELGNLVGNGSLALDIGESDYSAILESIGKLILESLSTFKLDRAPTNSEEMTLKIVHSDGSITEVGASQYSIQNKSIVITDPDVILGFSQGDQVLINYQPKTVF